MRKSAQKNLGEAEIGKFGHVSTFNATQAPSAASRRPFGVDQVRWRQAPRIGPSDIQGKGTLDRSSASTRARPVYATGASRAATRLGGVIQERGGHVNVGVALGGGSIRASLCDRSGIEARMCAYYENDSTRAMDFQY
jgi:hypothetical protein